MQSLPGLEETNEDLGPGGPPVSHKRVLVSATYVFLHKGSSLLLKR